MAKSGGYIEVTVRFFKEGDQWTAQCVELGTATCADTLEEAETAIEDMVHLHLDALGDVGERQKFLKAHGVTLHRGSVDRTPRRKTDVSEINATNKINKTGEVKRRRGSVNEVGLLFSSLSFALMKPSVALCSPRLSRH